MLFKLFRYLKKCSRASPSIFYPFALLLGMTASVEVFASINLKSLSVGESHTCGIKTDGSVVCWGDDRFDQSIPPSGTFAQISASSNYTCGVKTDGRVACWGRGSFDHTPPDETFTQISGSSNLVCGVTNTYKYEDGNDVVCWGSDWQGRGNPLTGLRFIQVSTGDTHACGVTIYGELVCWGDDQVGQSIPPSGTFTQVSATFNRTCGVKTNGNVACWGLDDWGAATPPSGTFTQVSASYDHTCGVKTNGSVACWGLDDWGKASPPAGSFTQVSTGRDETCGIKTDGSVKCWGFGGDNYGIISPLSIVSYKNKLGTGQGRINWKRVIDQEKEYDENDKIIVTAKPNAGSIFGGWSGACSGMGTCQLTRGQNKNIAATFNLIPPKQFALTVSKNGTGSGRITGQRIDCGNDCTEKYDENTQVILTAKQGTNFIFVGWNGVCSGMTTTCQVTMTQNKSVTATFNKDETPPSDGIHTLILTNRMKLTQLYGPTQADQLMNKLNELAEHSDVQGLVIQVEDDSMVANAYAIRGDNYDNRNQANVVVVSIKQLIRRHWDTLENQLENIMLIGDDRVIPFYRIADGTFEPDPWTLTDDFYTDRNPTECATCANPLVFIPDIAGGRLIETPAQIIGMIDAFLADNNLNIRSAAITGYDFVQDGAKAACDTLQRVDIPSDCSLMGESWGSDDFKDQILNRHHDITSINGHAYYEMFLTPDDKNIWASDFANSSTDFAGTLFYTVGCHSGLNVPDKLDLPESFALKQANYIANTGYGIGGLDGIELSEELMWNLTKELVKSKTTLGKALLSLT